DKIIVKRTNYEKFKKKLGIPNERFEEISRGLYNIKRI
ncbi:radical SAM protein, partial [Clostridioides difficile]|nr:radical SAM protein [Clostridioides difficile]